MNFNSCNLLAFQNNRKKHFFKFFLKPSIFSLEFFKFDNSFINNYISSFSVQRKINFIKTWKNIKISLSLEVSLKFLDFHKNRLKNIFCFYFGDIAFWDQIQSLIEFGLLNFSLDFVYEQNSIFKTSFLSIILLEIYFYEFDIFMSDLCFRFTSFKSLYSPYNFLHGARSYRFGTNYFPLQLERFIINIRNLRNLCKTEKNFKHMVDFGFASYIKNLLVSRYKNHLLLGFISSNKFVFLVKNKLFYFLRSVLLFDLKNFSISSNKICFLGFDVNFSYYLKDGNSTGRSVKFINIKNFELKVFSRLNFFKRKFFKSFLQRIRYELITNFLRKKDLNKIIFKNKLDYKFWSYFFQIESSRCFRYYVLIFADDSINRCSNYILA